MNTSCALIRMLDSSPKPHHCEGRRSARTFCPAEALLSGLRLVTCLMLLIVGEAAFASLRF